MEDLIQELLKNWRILKRHRNLSIVFALLTLSVGLGFIFSLPHKYQADSTVFIEQNVINSLVKGLAVTPDPNSKIRVLRYALLSRTMIGDVLKKMDPVLLPPEMDEQGLITGLKDRTGIRIKGKDLFTVSIEDVDPRFARDYINTLVNTYVEQNIERTRDETYGANRFLDEQVALFKKKLDKAEDAIIAFRKQHGVYVAVDENSILKEIRRLEESSEQLDLDLGSLEARKTELSRQLKSVRPTMSIRSEVRKDQREALLKQQIQQLLMTYTENYPEVIRLQAELEALKQMGPVKQLEAGGSTTSAPNPVWQQLSQQKLDVESEVSAIKAKKVKVDRMIQTRKDDLRFVPENKKRLALLEKEKTSLQKLYEQLLGRVSQAEMSKQMEIGNKTTTFRVVDQAILPGAPSSPNIPRLLLLVMAASVIAGGVAAIAWEMMNVSIKRLDDLAVEEIPVIGVVSHIPLDAEKAKAQKRFFIMLGIAIVYYAIVAALYVYVSFLK